MPSRSENQGMCHLFVPIIWKEHRHVTCYICAPTFMTSREYTKLHPQNTEDTTEKTDFWCQLNYCLEYSSNQRQRVMIEQGIYISQVENNEVENGYIKNRNKSGQCTVEENVHEIVIMNFGWWSNMQFNIKAQERTNHKSILNIQQTHTLVVYIIRTRRKRRNRNSTMRKAERQSMENRKERSNNARERLRKARITLTE